MVMTSHSPSNIVIQRPITPLTTLVVAAAAIVITLVSALTPVLLSLVLVGIAPDFTKSINSPDASIAVGLGIKAAITAPTLLVCITLCLTIGRRWFGIERRSLAWRFSPAALVWLLVMMGVAGLIAFGVGLLQDLLPATLPTEAEPAWPWWAKVVNTIILAFLLQGIPEELIWRGWVVAILGRQKSTFWITVTVFTALHLISQGGQRTLLDHLLYLATPFGLAVAATAVRFASGSIWAAVGVHAGLHMSSLVDTAMNTPNSPGVWVATGFGWLLVGGVIMVRYWDRMPWTDPLRRNRRGRWMS